MPRIAGRLFLAALAFVASAGAQEPAQTDTAASVGTVVIEGTVLEAATRAPIAGARIVLRYATSEVALETAAADINGRFHFSIGEAGEYAVEASTDGYLPVAAKVPIEEAALGNSAAHARSITLVLSRTVAIVGRVRDGSTKEGLPGLTVTALRITYLQGKRRFNPDRISFTDDHGDFRLEQLPPGEYFIEIKKFPPGPILAGRQADYTAESRLPSRYPQTIWPGDAFDPDNPPLTATSIGEINVGNVDLTKVEPGRIRGGVAGSDCAAAATYSLTLEQRFGSRIIENREATLPCGSAFSVPDLSPGHYRIRAQGANLAEAMLSEIKIEAGEDRDLGLKLQSRERVDGKIVLECKDDCRAGTRIDQVSLRPLAIDPEIFGASSQVQDNTFRLPMPLADRLRVDIRPLPDGMFIKRVLYNGAEVGTTFTPNPFAEVETLQITLSDQASSLLGTVTRDGKAVADAHVAIARSPLVLEGGWPDCIWVAVNEDGSFTFHGLPPGGYRVASLGPAEWARWQMPGAAEGLLSAGVEITLAEAESKTVTLK